MQNNLVHLFKNNQNWADKMLHNDPDFFRRLLGQQRPEYLWIGCSDSRVPANEIVGLLPGELFVHRNVANVILQTDFNCLSVLQFAVEVLQVQHIIVCGHYGCSGILATLSGARLGLVDNWLRSISRIREKNITQINALTSETERQDRLCELNVIEQVSNVCQTTILQDAWRRGQKLSIHGWIYGLEDGLLRDLGMCVTQPEELSGCYEAALKNSKPRPHCK
jgi:carbonic anhydrase